VGAEFVATNPYDDILVSHFAVAGDWSARLLLFDPKPPSNATAALHLVDAIANQITPSIHNIYMLRRIRARAQAAQRSRLAQELHDGAIQSLVAAGLQLEVLRRTLPLPESAVNDIGRVQEVIRSEMYNLRAVVQDLRLRSMPTREISTELTQLVNRFREFTDITVKLTCDRRCDNMAPSVAQELLRIAQEALANVRKHSACKQVAVELKNAGDAVELTVKDDGVGFEFEGQMTLEQLEKTRSGPVTIRQRLRDLGGNLLIESHPGQGSRLSITVPYVVRDADA
jgi:signal transduction histidine kinase